MGSTTEKLNVLFEQMATVPPEAAPDAMIAPLREMCVLIQSLSPEEGVQCIINYLARFRPGPREDIDALRTVERTTNEKREFVDAFINDLMVILGQLESVRFKATGKIDNSFFISDGPQTPQ